MDVRYRNGMFRDRTVPVGQAALPAVVFRNKREHCLTRQVTEETPTCWQFLLFLASRALTDNAIFEVV